MTMLHHTDTDDASYLGLAEFLSTYGKADILNEPFWILYCGIMGWGIVNLNPP
jgi:hypothetical protein